MQVSKVGSWIDEPRTQERGPGWPPLTVLYTLIKCAFRVYYRGPELSLYKLSGSNMLYILFFLFNFKIWFYSLLPGCPAAMYPPLAGKSEKQLCKTSIKIHLFKYLLKRYHMKATIYCRNKKSGLIIHHITFDLYLAVQMYRVR